MIKPIDFLKKRNYLYVYTAVFLILASFLLAVPYSKGWKGYIDGSESEVFLVNDHYLGMSVPEGEHDI